MTKEEVQNHIDGLVSQGFIKRIGKDKYDVSPFIDILGKFSADFQNGNDIDIQEIVNNAIGK
ncbi:hypothetical protein U9J35_01550 [Rossellomorea aquimaris]|nr:hypothetical protein [Rossellomorea aquimaris]WRP06881.1 hypothetical protein U9J35_01550 [Rossellomorea aquimaris]